MRKPTYCLFISAAVILSANAYALAPEPPVLPSDQNLNADVNHVDVNHLNVPHQPTTGGSSGSSGGSSGSTGGSSGSGSSGPVFNYPAPPPGNTVQCANLSYYQCYYSTACYTYVDPYSGNYQGCVPI